MPHICAALGARVVVVTRRAKSWLSRVNPLHRLLPVYRQLYRLCSSNSGSGGSRATWLGLDRIYMNGDKGAFFSVIFSADDYGCRQHQKAFPDARPYRSSPRSMELFAVRGSRTRATFFSCWAQAFTRGTFACALLYTGIHFLSRLRREDIFIGDRMVRGGVPIWDAVVGRGDMGF